MEAGRAAEQLSLEDTRRLHEQEGMMQEVQLKQQQQHVFQQQKQQQQKIEEEIPPQQPASTNMYMSGGVGGGVGGGGGSSDLMDRKRALERQLRELEEQMGVGGGKHTD